MASNPNIRLHFIGFIFTLFALILIGRLFHIQILLGAKYMAEAEGQYENTGTRLYDRGTIYFKNKDNVLVSAATLKRGRSLVIDTTLLKDSDSAFRALSNLLPIDKETFFLRAGKKNDPHEEIMKNIDEKTAEKIEDLHIDGVTLPVSQWRYYPGKSLGSHALGFVGYNDEGFSGQYGLERYYESTLARDGGGLYKNFFTDIFSDIGSVISGEDVRKAGDIVLTIDTTVENAIEKELEGLEKDFNIKSGGVIVIRPDTGEIVGMGAVPDFDPNDYGAEKDISVFTNPLVSNLYEFGSIVKPLTLAAAIDAGAITEKDTYHDEGYVIIEDARINNFDKKGRGTVSMQEILNQSLNTGAVYVMQKLGRASFRDYMEGFGLGGTTNIDLPGETNGNIENLYTNHNVEFATASFGQGIAISPIGMTRALATLANGGMLVRPHLVAEFTYNGLPSRIVRTEEQGKVLKESTTERVATMLTEVVDTALLDGKVKLPHHSIAAKTGTAQIPNNEGGYYSDQFLHAFFGYFPAYDPEFLVFLYIVRPERARYASETLTNPFMNITKFLINYYEIPPDR